MPSLELPPIPEIIAFLQAAEPEMLDRMGEAAVVENFRSAARDVPAWSDLLRRHGADPAAVTDIGSFRRWVPFTDKASTFLRYPIEQLCRGGRLAGIKSIVPSSGHSGTFAFSVDTAEGASLAATSADLAFEYVLEVSRRPAMILNCYPMGLQVPTSLAVANAGVNVDVALALARTFAPHWEQLVLVGTPLFVKALLEAGLEAGLDWGRLRTTVVAGGESFSESWRTYVSGLLGIGDADAPTDRVVAGTMGAAEVGLNLFHEVPETIRIVRRAYRDPALHRSLFGDCPWTPHLFLYYPMRTYVETTGEEALAVSHTATDLPLPLFRYRTGDRVRLLPRARLETALAGALPLPGLRLPCAAVLGRGEEVETGGRPASVEQLKEAILRDPAVAPVLTGFFRFRGEREGISLVVQLREGARPAGWIEDGVGAACLACGVPEPVRIELAPYEAYPGPATHERKHRYLLPPRSA